MEWKDILVVGVNTGIATGTIGTLWAINHVQNQSSDSYGFSPLAVPLVGYGMANVGFMAGATGGLLCYGYQKLCRHRSQTASSANNDAELENNSNSNSSSSSSNLSSTKLHKL